MDMKITDLIKKLKEIKSEHGNLLVVLPTEEESRLVTIRDEDLVICTDGDMCINDFDQCIDDLEDKKVIVIGDQNERN